MAQAGQPQKFEEDPDQQQDEQQEEEEETEQEQPDENALDRERRQPQPVRTRLNGFYQGLKDTLNILKYSQGCKN